MKKRKRDRDIECTAADIRKANDLAVLRQLRQERKDRLIEIALAVLLLLGLVVVLWWLGGGGH